MLILVVDKVFSVVMHIVVTKSKIRGEVVEKRGEKRQNGTRSKHDQTESTSQTETSDS